MSTSAPSGRAEGRSSLFANPAVGRGLSGLSVGVLFLLFILPRDGWIIDDALIYQSYVRSAAAGEGFVYGPGAPVEGFSSPLWTLLLTALAKVGLTGFVAAKGFGVLCGLLCAASVIGLPKTTPLPLRLGAGVLLALQPALLWWSASGMETPLVCLGTAALCLAVVHRRTRWAFAIAGLLAIARPEGVLHLVALTVAALRAEDGELAARGKKLAPWIALGLAPALLWQLYRVVTYDAWLGNAAMAKLGEASNERDLLWVRLDYYGDAIQRLAGPWLFALVATFSSRPKRNRDGIALGEVLAVNVALHVVFLWVARGDWMPWSRLALPLLPMLVLWGAVAASRARGLGRRACLAALGAALLLTLTLLRRDHVPAYAVHAPSGHRMPATIREGRRPLVDPLPAEGHAHFYGAVLARFSRPGDVVMHVDVGQSGYLFGDVTIVDAFGLVGRDESAFRVGALDAAGLARAFADKKPSVVFYLVKPDTEEPFFDTQRALRDVILRDYSVVAVQPWWGKNQMQARVRHELLERKLDAARLDALLQRVPGLTFDRARLVDPNWFHPLLR